MASRNVHRYVGLAILNREEEAATIADVLDRSPSRITSPIAIYEAILGLCRAAHASVEEADTDVAEFLQIAGIDCVVVTQEDAQAALIAFARYGKGRGHPARLNMGDCFAYAAARIRGMPLLYKGNDFTRTDIESAVL
jgi:ribonuclease VapC